MRVRLLYFASFRDAAGRDEENREIAAGSTVGSLWKALTSEQPLFSAFPRMPAAAVNRAYADAARALADGDEVAFLPPVAGG
jgi:molybdopterin converting factor subunit 1